MHHRRLVPPAPSAACHGAVHRETTGAEGDRAGRTRTGVRGAGTGARGSEGRGSAVRARSTSQASVAGAPSGPGGPGPLEPDVERQPAPERGERGGVRAQDGGRGAVRDGGPCGRARGSRPGASRRRRGGARRARPTGGVFRAGPVRAPGRARPRASPPRAPRPGRGTPSARRGPRARGRRRAPPRGRRAAPRRPTARGSVGRAGGPHRQRRERLRRGRPWCAGPPPGSRSANRSSSSTRPRQSWSPGRCWTRPTRAASPAGVVARGSTPVTRRSPVTVPGSVWGTTPTSARSSVDFPQPEGPSTSSPVPAGTVRVRSSSTHVASWPTVTVRPAAETASGTVPGTVPGMTSAAASAPQPRRSVPIAKASSAPVRERASPRRRAAIPHSTTHETTCTPSRSIAQSCPSQPNRTALNA